MAPPNKDINYNDLNYKFPPDEESAPLYKRGLLSKKLLPIILNKERFVLSN